MVTGAAPAFDHRVSGTSEQQWASSLAGLPTAPLDLGQYSAVVVVGAHPDDESLGAGGLVAAAARLGLSVTVLVASLGERSHPDSPTHTPGDLARVRRDEVFRAIGLLAPTATVRLLGLPDGRLDEHLDHLVLAITGAVHDRSTLLVAPFQGDGHPDHQAVGRAAALVARSRGVTALEYPIWLWHWSSPGLLSAGITRLDLDPVDLTSKRDALRCHVSQTQPLSGATGDEAIVSPSFAAHFDRPYEIFVEANVPAEPEAADQVDSDSPERSLPREFFDDFYSDHADPWGFETRWYEQRKRALTLASLPRQRFANAYEPGCSIGVLTAALAQRCDRLLGTDISDAPLDLARARLSDATGVRLERRRVPEEWPAEKFDLIVLSEIGYYCDAEDLDVLVARASQSLTSDGVLVACHWRHPVDEYPIGGDQVHRALRAKSGLALLAGHQEEDFLLDVFVPHPAVSVAGRTGLLG